MKNLKNIIRTICYGRNRRLFARLYNLILYAPTIFCLMTRNFDALTYTISIALIGDMLYVLALITTVPDDGVVVNKIVNKKESRYMIKFRCWFSSLMGNKVCNFIYNAVLYVPIVILFMTRNYTALNRWFLVAFAGEAIYIIGTGFDGSVQK